MGFGDNPHGKITSTTVGSPTVIFTVEWAEGADLLNIWVSNYSGSDDDVTCLIYHAEETPAAADNSFGFEIEVKANDLKDWELSRAIPLRLGDKVAFAAKTSGARLIARLGVERRSA